MTDGGEPIPPGAEPDPALAELAEEITRRLQSGEAVEADAFATLHPELADPIRELLPTMHDLMELGRLETPASEGTRPGHPYSPARKNSSS